MLIDVPEDDPTDHQGRNPGRHGAARHGAARRGAAGREGTRRPSGRRTRSGTERRSTPEARRRHQGARQAARATIAQIRYPDQLPVVARKDDIAAAIRDHQVVVIAGETGSGKTTQIPKVCLDLGLGVTGMIGHTQPRRIAARSVAERLADELHVELGQQVGYQVRFTDHSAPGTLVKVMTDGVLLNELQRDRELRNYEVIIVDEAHERSLNIDFILGYLRRILPRRPDLKVIITSATIDPDAFARHFATNGKPAPIIEVSGRTYPVEIRYRPLLRPATRPTRGAGAPPGEDPPPVEIDQVTGIVEAVEELWTEAAHGDGQGQGQDILTFLAGEREIRDAAEALEGLKLPDTEILPLYARLTAAEQHRVFSRHSGRRVVLATNVAETSLTVPGIRYVVDAGTARISRYSQRTKVQRLPIEPISQASARQRSGRCGRVADGIAIRLYSEEDYESRPTFTEPEILRTNLASVILQMTSLGLGDLARFPFVDRPDSRQITDGVRLLTELGAIDDQAEDPRRRLTDVGRKLATLPVDPRLARMLVEADRNGALREVLVIVAALSIQDVRERPADKQTQADQAHARFRDEDSDFISLLNLWKYLRGQQRELSGSAFRRMCQREYLHYLRIREWQDLHAQLRSIARDLRLSLNDHPASADTIHQSLLAGLLSHVGLRDPDRRDYLGARGARFAIQPGSTLFRRPPDWVMAAELVETTRLWARTNAAIDPAWVEAAAQHLVKRHHSEPRWSKSRGSAVATERVTLYGVPLATDRTVALGRIDPALARELFIRHALVEGEWDTPHRFFHDNRKLLASLADLEHRARRRDILVGDDTLVDFYERRIPEHVISAAHFDAWWKKERRRKPELLTFTEELLVSDDADDVLDDVAVDYPKEWVQGELTLPLTYQFEPGTEADGVTVHIPVDVLNRVEPEGFDWLVPGLRPELATALVKSLPKSTRKRFVPAPDHALAALAETDPDEGPITDELARGLYIRTGSRVPPGQWDWDRVPDHLRMTFRVDDARGRRLGESKDLAALKEQLAPQVRTTMAKAASAVERTGLTSWTFGDLPATFEQTQRPARRAGRRPAAGDTAGPAGGPTIIGFPALVDRGDHVDIQVLPTEQEQRAASRLGVRRLLLLNTTAPWPRVLSLLTNAQKLALGNNPHGSVPALLDDCLAAAVDAIVAQVGADPMSRGRATPHTSKEVMAGPSRGGAVAVRDESTFEQTLADVRREIVPRVIEVVELVHPVLERALQVRLALDRIHGAPAATLKADLAAQLDGLVYDGFVAATGVPQLRQLPRYLQGMLVRLDTAPGDLARDTQRVETIRRVEAERAKVIAGLPAADRQAADVAALRWMVEELRVSLFAQRLGTAYPISEKRIYTAMNAVEDARD